MAHHERRRKEPRMNPAYADSPLEAEAGIADRSDVLADGARAVDKRPVKASFNLPADELEALKRLAERRGTTATQVVRQSLATELHLQRIVDQGGTILAKIGRRAQELIFSQMQLS